MMYKVLAGFYDALVKDDDATKLWVDFIKKYLHKKEVLELACGSGEITIALAYEGYEITATDLSKDMIKTAEMKAGSDKVKWNVMDMRNITFDKQFDGILCLCDSFNYLLNDEDVKNTITQVYKCLKEDGVFIMDMHSLDRIEEFKNEFFEDGMINGCGYQWTINTYEDKIYQNFAFYDHDGNATLEQHIQRVYDPTFIQNQLQLAGFEVKIYTDFVLEGIQHGEKYFYVCKKG